ncbi:MAG: YqgE/AlgH family protein [Nocardioides sp.]
MDPVAPGVLLLATPAMLDPNFAESVVLVLDADHNGAMGVVLNRPSSVPVAVVLEGWDGVLAEPDVLFRGGPVQPDGALGVGWLRDVDDVPPGCRGVTAELSIIDLDTPPALVDQRVRGMRIFAGYAGWGAGQLQGEIAQGDWYVAPSEGADAFRADGETLWRDILRRQPGQLAWRATRPADPDLN